MGEKKEVEEKKKEVEPLFEMLANPARVMKAQLKVVTLEDARYRPMKDLSIGGIVMLNRRDKDEEIVEPMEVNKASTSSEEEGDEPAPPEPFEWKEEEFKCVPITLSHPMVGNMGTPSLPHVLCA